MRPNSPWSVSKPHDRDLGRTRREKRTGSQLWSRPMKTVVTTVWSSHLTTSASKSRQGLGQRQKGCLHLSSTLRICVTLKCFRRVSTHWFRPHSFSSTIEILRVFASQSGDGNRNREGSVFPAPLAHLWGTPRAFARIKWCRLSLLCWNGGQMRPCKHTPTSNRIWQ